jgi:hypothetical protein
MITLPSKLRFHGFTYTQVLRGVRSCVYEQTVTQEIKYFEVFTIRIEPETTIGGKFYPERERWPKDEDFGYTAWTYRDYEKALKKFNELEDEDEYK